MAQSRCSHFDAYSALIHTYKILDPAAENANGRESYRFTAETSIFLGIHLDDGSILHYTSGSATIPLPGITHQLALDRVSKVP